MDRTRAVPTLLKIDASPPPGLSGLPEVGFSRRKWRTADFDGGLIERALANV